MVWVNLPSPQFMLKDISCIITLYFALFINYVLGRLGLLGQDITSACSSDTYMTVCRIVLQGGGGACQSYVLLSPVSAITNRTSCTLYRLVYDDSRQLECPKSRLKMNHESCPLHGEQARCLS